MTSRRRLALFIAAALLGAAWLNAAQEKRAACTTGSCSPMAAILTAMANDSKAAAR